MLLAVAATLSGCGGSSGSSTSFKTVTEVPISATQATTTAAPAPTTTTAAAGSQGPVIETQTIRAKTTDSYTMRMTVDAYRMVQADALPPLPYSGRGLIVSCSVNSQTDAVIPVGFSITNTTPQFTEPLAIRFHLGADFEDHNRDVEGDDQFADGSTECGGLVAPYGLYDGGWTVPPNQTVQGSFYVILHNYFGPSHPAGDPTYDGLTIDAQFFVGEQGAQTEADPDDQIKILP